MYSTADFIRRHLGILLAARIVLRVRDVVVLYIDTFAGVTEYMDEDRNADVLEGSKITDYL